MISIFGIEITPAGFALGVITGLTYGLLAVGLILIYRSNKFINFAHGEIGAFGAGVLAVAVVRWHFPYWVAFPVGIAAAGAMAGVVEMAVVRRLRKVPRLMSVVATIGAGQFVLLLTLALAHEVRSSSTFPQPVGLPDFKIGVLRMTPAHSGMLLLSPIVVVGLAWFLRASRYGLFIRGSAVNPEASRVAGVSASKMSTIAWVIAGGISAITAILVFPTRGLITADALGPGLLLRALVAAVASRMSNMPVALAAGVVVGVVEQTLLLNFSSHGLVQMVLFVGILLALLFQNRQGLREEEKGSWTAVQPWRPLPEAFLRVGSIRNLGRIVAIIGLIGALIVATLATNRTAIVLVTIVSFSLVGLSVAMLTGMAGQLSLGQFALAAIGAVVSYRITEAGGNFLFGFMGAGIGAAFASVLIGIPALRIRGLMLAVTTLGFALAAQAWLLQQPWSFGGNVSPKRPQIGPFIPSNSKEYFFLALVFFVIGLVLYHNLRKGGFGRALIALRDNEEAARAFSIPVVRRKLQAFALAGFIAGVGGALYSHALSTVSFQTFTTDESIRLVAMTVIGGIATLAGPLIGAFYILGIRAFVPLDAAGLATSALGWLILILYYPGGLAELIRPLRDRLVDRLARGAGLDATAIRSEGETELEMSDTLLDSARVSIPPSGPFVKATPLLEAINLRKHYGGVVAVEEVSFTVHAGETVGIIGPNGAGKTSLFELISGFTRPDAGTVRFEGNSMDGKGPESRARSGLIRSFQDAFLFPTLSVMDTIRLALEREDPSSLAVDLFGLPKRERRKDARARELIHLMGLDRYRHKQISELSTGTRRIAELTALIALRPKLLLLDEPSSGIAQRETEILGQVLTRVRSYLDTTLVVIEHDMPLITALSDRMLAMESGRIIAEGLPREVQNHRRVIESYLGADLAAIERSGQTSAEAGHEPQGAIATKRKTKAKTTRSGRVTPPRKRKS